MRRTDTPARSGLLHVAGVALLAVAWLSGHALSAIGFGRAGQEPAIAYLLALCTFLSASAGVALTILGPRLFRRVIVADRWLPHVPALFRDTEQENRADRHPALEPAPARQRSLSHDG